MGNPAAVGDRQELGGVSALKAGGGRQRIENAEDEASEGPE